MLVEMVIVIDRNSIEVVYLGIIAVRYAVVVFRFDEVSFIFVIFFNSSSSYFFFIEKKRKK